MIMNLTMEDKSVLILTNKDDCKLSSVLKKFFDEAWVDIVNYDKEGDYLGYSTETGTRSRNRLTEDHSLVIIVAPVHNGSYPGSLKTLLDFYVPRGQWKSTPVAGVIHAGGPRFGMVWDNVYYPWLRMMDAQVLHNHIYLDPEMKTAFESLDTLADEPEFLSLVVDPFLEGIRSAVGE